MPLFILIISDIFQIFEPDVKAPRYFRHLPDIDGDVKMKKLGSKENKTVEYSETNFLHRIEKRDVKELKDSEDIKLF